MHRHHIHVVDGPYIPLREQLAQDSPDLSASLMRSWRIAEKEWLPAVSGNAGSFNSFPHLRNLEHYADDILRQLWETKRHEHSLSLSPVEKYLLLAAILFHDIGRTGKAEPHAYESRKLIISNFADLGIEGRPLALILADICCYHDCTPEQEKELELHDRAVTPYGVIHCLQIAVLLRLIDNLDSAYTRVLPHYLHYDESNIIEGLRRNTSSVRVDVRNRLVATSIGFSREGLKQGKVRAFQVSSTTPGQKDWRHWEDIELTPNPDYAFGDHAPPKIRELRPLSVCLKKPPNEVIKHLRGLRVGVNRKYLPRLIAKFSEGEESGRRSFRDLFEHVTKRLCDKDFRALVGLSGKNNKRLPFACAETPNSSYLPIPHFSPTDWAASVPYLLMRKIAFPFFNRKTQIADLSRVLFLVLAGNVRSCCELLKGRLQQPLETIGISARSWLIEYEDHLFTCEGKETFEPTLSHDFLREVVDRMWFLSAGMFGRDPCSYRTLAAKLREADVELVRTAVRRLNIITRHPDSNGQVCSVVEAGVTQWTWRGRMKADSACSDRHCLSWVIKCIADLGDPTEETT